MQRRDLIHATEQNRIDTLLSSNMCEATRCIGRNRPEDSHKLPDYLTYKAV
jgi:hypothetical protein